jgi:RNA polymerase-interacting CarD/CdnL/TRCF family regulator
MTKRKGLKIGSKIIEQGKVYRVFGIEKKKVDGKMEIIIHYQPLYTNVTNNTIVCSIPESRLKRINVRRPVSKKEMDELLEDLSKRSKEKDSLEIVKAKLILGLNNIYKTAAVIKRYWREKKQEGDGFSKTKNDILNMAIDRSVEEVALVNETTLSKAKDKIIVALH